MRVFIVLCLVAVACAESGYNYGTGAHSGSYGAGSSVEPSYTGGSNYDAASSNDAASYGDQGGASNTEFFTFTADEEDFNEPAASNQYSSYAQQNHRVIFIKGPENNALENAALALAKNAASQKTAVYVLNKQFDLGDLSNKLNQINNNANNKPDVHFVKYRTPEDAANAQHAIQSQYAGLGGQTQSHNGGVAPVLNFASQAQRGSHGSFGSGSAPSNSYVAPAAGSLSPSYLPASFLRRYRHK
ncbi:uncharacterized protein LOC142233816 [Haematobia irritans]|uniref:uncharacterized protein LOC142233816 n=1 Tax=Haematobia irritans TaxID=7368 RepID=UPI003F50CCB3